MAPNQHVNPPGIEGGPIREFRNDLDMLFDMFWIVLALGPSGDPMGEFPL